MTAAWCNDPEPHGPHHEPMPPGYSDEASWCAGTGHIQLHGGRIDVASTDPEFIEAVIAANPDAEVHASRIWFTDPVDVQD